MNWIIVIITGTLSIMGSIILSIAANLLTDPIKNWLDSRSLISKRKRLSSLQEELKYITKLHQNRQELYLEVAINLTRSLFLFFLGAFGIIVLILTIILLISTPPIKEIGLPEIFSKIFKLIIAIGSLISLIMTIILTTAANAGAILFARCLTLLRKVRDFDEYKQKTEDRITELSQAIE